MLITDCKLSAWTGTEKRNVNALKPSAEGIGRGKPRYARHFFGFPHSERMAISSAENAENRVSRQGTNKKKREVPSISCTNRSHSKKADNKPLHDQTRQTVIRLFASFVENRHARKRTFNHSIKLNALKPSAEGIGRGKPRYARHFFGFPHSERMAISSAESAKGPSCRSI